MKNLFPTRLQDNKIVITVNGSDRILNNRLFHFLDNVRYHKDLEKDEKVIAAYSGGMFNVALFRKNIVARLLVAFCYYMKWMDKKRTAYLLRNGFMPGRDAWYIILTEIGWVRFKRDFYKLKMKYWSPIKYFYRDYFVFTYYENSWSHKIRERRYGLVKVSASRFLRDIFRRDKRNSWHVFFMSWHIDKDFMFDMYLPFISAIRIAKEMAENEVHQHLVLTDPMNGAADDFAKSFNHSNHIADIRFDELRLPNKFKAWLYKHYHDIEWSKYYDNPAPWDYIDEEIQLGDELIRL